MRSRKLNDMSELNLFPALFMSPEDVEKVNRPLVNALEEIKNINSIHLVILGEPKSQKRHRSVKMGNFVRQYDPSANDKGDFLSIVQNKAPKEPLNCPVSLCLSFYFSRPKSHYKTGKNSHLLKDSPPLWHLSKPDADNCIKFCMDALNKIYWKDDSKICKVSIQKQYSDNPRTEITITTL